MPRNAKKGGMIEGYEKRVEKGEEEGTNHTG
jgi:hypothetical protein